MAAGSGRSLPSGAGHSACGLEGSAAVLPRGPGCPRRLLFPREQMGLGITAYLTACGPDLEACRAEACALRWLPLRIPLRRMAPPRQPLQSYNRKAWASSSIG